MAKSGSQTKLGKAFEYACVIALYDKYRDTQDVIVEDTARLPALHLIPAALFLHLAGSISI